MLEFGREFLMPGGETARMEFRLAFAADMRSPIFSAFPCQRINVPNVDRSKLVAHANGSISIRSVVLTEPNPTDFQYLLQELLNEREIEAHSFGMDIKAENSTVSVLTHEGYEMMFGVRLHGKERGLRARAIVFGVGDTGAVLAKLKDSGIAYRQVFDRIWLTRHRGRCALLHSRLPDEYRTGPECDRRTVTFANDAPLSLIAGPCQLESRDHAFMMAGALKDIADKLGIGLVYKTSYDKANRTSMSGKRGLGLEKSLQIFRISGRSWPAVLTDVHTEEQCGIVGEVVDILQIPAFLSRQTDLLVAAAKTGKVVNIKKGQFLAPWDMKNVAAKVTRFRKQQGSADRTRRILWLQYACL